MKKLALATAAAAAVATTAAATVAVAAPPSDGVTLQPVGRYATGVFDESAAEIVAHDASTQLLFVVNANDGTVDVLDVADPTAPVRVAQLAPGGSPNSVDARDGLVAVAVAADDAVANGTVQLYDAAAVAAGDTTAIATLEVGVGPDMVTFGKSGDVLLVANEGEPEGYEEGDVDPVGSVSVIDLADDLADSTVRTAGFEAFEGDALPEGVRVFGPGASVAQDLEPEYVAVSHTGREAYVSLQENNAIAVLDVRRAVITDLLPLGAKDHSLPGMGLDASDRDDAINIATWPVRGLYMPDSIAAYRVRGTDYVLTANEGDAREYDGYVEELRVKDLGDPDETDLPGLCDEALAEDGALGRLNITIATIGIDGSGDAPCVDELYSYGARSFSIFTTDGELVFDSGDGFEQVVAGLIADGELPEHAFNANNDETPSFESRSDNKGPEPEAITLGRIGPRTYAFVGLERVGGIMVYDVTRPADATFVDYVTTRRFDEDAFFDDAASFAAADAGDLGPEAIEFIPAEDSPSGVPMLAVGHEVSGSTVLFEIVGLR